MPVEMTPFIQKGLDGPEVQRVTDIAVRLLDHLNEPSAQMQIAAANQPGGSSALVQAVFARQAAELGFNSEKKGLFASYRSALRPDYYLPLTELATGIILEVERGKTTTNNMDLLDMWKCHLCESAHHLFLLVRDRDRRVEDRWLPDPTRTDQGNVEALERESVREVAPREGVTT